MRYFIFKTLLFFILFLATDVALLYYSSSLNVKREFKKIPSDKEVIFIGNSRPECAFNDSLITNSKNLAFSGESYLYTYNKLKCILEGEHEIKYAYLQFSPSEISSNKDSTIWKNNYALKFIPMYLYKTDITDILYVFSKDPVNLKCLSPQYIIKNLGWCDNVKNVRCYTDIRGGFRGLQRTATENDKTIANSRFSFKVGKRNLHYLKKIVILLNQHKIKVVFVALPTIKKDIPENIKENFFQIRKQEFSNIPYLDFSSFPLELNEFGDASHLNNKGANKLSVFFQGLINQGLLTNTNQEAFFYAKLSELNTQNN